MTRLAAAIGHPNELCPCNLVKARDMAVARLSTRAYQTYANFFFCHGTPPEGQRRSIALSVSCIARNEEDKQVRKPPLDPLPKRLVSSVPGLRGVLCELSGALPCKGGEIVIMDNAFP